MPKDDHASVNRVEALDLLRLVAVLGVVLYHYGFRGPNIGDHTWAALPELSPFAMYGYLGVPAFFVISGFVIAYSAEGRTASEFAIARFSRIYPTFVLCMTITAAGILIFGGELFHVSLPRWTANLVIASPALGFPYMDSAYWSLVIEMTFYAWVTVFIATGLFARRLDALVLAWLFLSMANELTADSSILEKVFLTDNAGYFATGLMLYEFHRGRRDVMWFCIFGLSVGIAIFHAIHSLGWLHAHSDVVFQPSIVATIFLASVAAIFLATRLNISLLPSKITIAIGALTYPFYLLHQQLGYAILSRFPPQYQSPTTVCLIILAIAAASWAICQYIEVPLRTFTRQLLSKALLLRAAA